MLFKGTVGGTAGPGGDLGKLKHSILEVLLTLDDDTVVLPGHCEATTIGEERRSNPFVRAWLRGEGLGEEPCRVGGEEATLLLWAPDYDGGHKALVRFPSGEETIVGGSRVSRPSPAPLRVAMTTSGGLSDVLRGRKAAASICRSAIVHPLRATHSRPPPSSGVASAPCRSAAPRMPLCAG